MPAFSSPSVLRALHRQSLLLGALTLLLFIVGDIHQAAIGFDSRFVMFAKEMLRHGPSFFPTTYGEPYADYNATTTVFTWLLSLPFARSTHRVAVTDGARHVKRWEKRKPACRVSLTQ